MTRQEACRAALKKAKADGYIKDYLDGENGRWHCIPISGPPRLVRTANEVHFIAEVQRRKLAMAK